MESFRLLQRRVERTKGWLNTFTRENALANQQEVEEEFDILGVDDESDSYLGVESLSEVGSSAVLSLMTGQTWSDDLQWSVGTCSDFCALDWHHPSYYKSPWACRTCGKTSPPWIPHEYELTNNYDEAPIDQKQANDYEAAGRDGDHTFADVRSASKARKRRRHQSEKYWAWRVIKPGLSGVQAYDTCDRGCGERCYCLWGNALKQDRIVTMDGKKVYEQAQQWPRPHVYNRKPKNRYHFVTGSRINSDRRERKHARGRISDMRHDLDWCDFHCEGHHHGDSFTACLNDAWDFHLQADYCHFCDLPWGRCNRKDLLEVDEIESLAFETSADGKSWTLQWTPGKPKENRAPAVLPYGPWDWAMVPYAGCYQGGEEERHPERALLWRMDISSWQVYEGLLHDPYKYDYDRYNLREVDEYVDEECEEE